MSRKRNSTDSFSRGQGAGALATQHPHRRSLVEPLSVVLGTIITLSRDLLETCDRLDANVAAEKRARALEVLEVAIQTLEAAIVACTEDEGANQGAALPNKRLTEAAP
jgi:hypothetical protein